MIAAALVDDSGDGLSGEIHLDKPPILIFTAEGLGVEVWLQRHYFPDVGVRPPAGRFQFQRLQCEAVMPLTDLPDLHGALRHRKGVPDEAFGGVNHPRAALGFVMVGKPEQPFSRLGEIPHDGAGTAPHTAPAVLHYGDETEFP